MDHRPFTLLYDSECPFCRAEVRWLLRRSEARGGSLRAIDIADPDFDAAVLGLGRDDVVRELHGIRADGTLTRAMESVRASYAAAGLGWMMAWTAWPGLRWIADAAYRVFAKYRVPVGRWLTGRGCDSGACTVPRRG